MVDITIISLMARTSSTLLTALITIIFTMVNIIDTAEKYLGIGHMDIGIRQR